MKINITVIPKLTYFNYTSNSFYRWNSAAVQNSVIVTVSASINRLYVYANTGPFKS